MALGGALGLVLVARDAAALCVALGDIYVRFTWQAWHNVTSFVLRGRCGTYGTGWRAWAGFGRPWRRGTLRGRRGAWSHLRSFHVAGVAQCHIFRFAWQVWHLWHWVARLGWFWSPVTPRHFAWQAWRLVTSTFVSRGRCGTMSHPPSFCVAGVALMALGGALGLVLVARDAAALCVAGVALGHIYVRFTWQAWHNVTSTVVLRGRRGTYGTGWRAWAGFGRPWRRGTLRGRRGTWWHLRSFHVAGVAQCHILRFALQAWHLWHWVARLGWFWSPVTPRHFAWQAWRLVTSTFVSRGRRGTMSHPPSFCVAGVAPSLTHPLSHATLSPTIFHAPSFTHHFVTHHLWHTIFHTPLCHTPSFTHDFVTRSLSHRTFTHTIFHHTNLHTPLCHTPSFTTPSFTHNFVTHNLSHTLCHTPSFTHTLSHTVFHTHFVTHRLSHNFVTRSLSHTPSFTHCFVTHTHTPSFFVTHHLSHSTLSHTHTCLNFSILHHLLCLSFLLRPCYNLWRSYWKKLTCGVIWSFNFWTGKTCVHWRWLLGFGGLAASAG